MNSSPNVEPRRRAKRVSEVVLDSSAILALLLGERGADRAATVINRAHVSAVNLAEVVQRLVDKGAGDDETLAVLEAYGWRVSPLDEAAAMQVGLYRRATRAHGLSLGDRACLALGKRLGLPVYTADRAWAELDLGVEVVLIR